MKWPAYLHTSTHLVGLHLKPDQKKMFNYLVKEMDRYLHAFTLRENLLKDFIDSWCEINNESFLPALHQIIKLIRHRLISGSSTTFHRLIHLCNALIRNGGTVAHALIGREKFLRTIVYCIETYARSRNVLYRDSAAFAYQCFKDWKNGLDERKDLFPYYSKQFNKVEKKYSFLENVSLGCYILPDCERVDVTVAEEYRILDPPPAMPILLPQEPIQFQRHISSPRQSFFSNHSNNTSNKSIYNKSAMMSEDEQSLQLNRFSDSSPSPRSISVNYAVENKLTIIPEEAKHDSPHDDDESTAEEQYCESSSTVNENETIVTGRDTMATGRDTMMTIGTRKSAGTILYPQIYEAGKSTDDIIQRPKSITNNKALNTKSIDYEYNNNLNIEVKYYGTQRVVSYKQGHNNNTSKTLVTSKSNSNNNMNKQPIMQQ